MPEKPDKIELEQLLSMYIDGDCSDAQRERIEAALAADPALRDLCNQLIRTVESIRDVGAEAAPTHVRQRILSQLERRALLDDGRRAGAGRTVLRRVVPLATAAMVLAMAGGGWWFYSHRETAPPVILADKGPTQPRRSMSESAPMDSHPAPQPVRSVMPSAAEPPAGHAQDMPRGVGGALPSPASQMAEPAEDVVAQDDTYCDAAAKAQVARQLAAQEVAEHLVTLRAAGASQPSSTDVPSAAMAGDASLGLPLSARAEPLAQQEAQEAAVAPEPLEPRRWQQDAIHQQGALEVSVQVLASYRQAVAAGAQVAVKDLGGQLIHMAAGPDHSALVAKIPLQMQFLLAEKISHLDGVAEVQLHQLAADAMSLEIASILTEPGKAYYSWPGNDLFAAGGPWSTQHRAAATMPGATLPVRIVIHAAAAE